MEKVIYQIRNLVNGKLYIGSTKNFLLRRREHLKSLRKNKYTLSALQNAWNKYGEAGFIFEIIYFVPLDIDSIWAEEQFIIFFNTIKNGYNIKLPFSEQGKNDCSYDKTSKNGKEAAIKWVNRNGPSNLKSMSKSEWLKERELDPTYKAPQIIKPTLYRRSYTIKPVIGVDINGNIIYRFDSGYKAGKHFGTGNIAICCNKNKSKGIGKHMSYGFYWFFEESFDKQAFLLLFKPKVKVIIPYRERKVKRTPITIQNIETEEILNFQSIVECSEYLKVNKVKIHDLIRGRRNKGRGVFSKVGSIKGHRLYRGSVV